MKITKKMKNNHCFERYSFGILIAIELLMSFTSLGYIHISPISVTIAYLPILVAGCLFGPIQSLIIGCIFGIASMYKASAYYVMPSDAVFSPFLSGAPVSSIFLSIGTRALFGFFIGMAFLFAEKRKHYRIWIGVLSAIAPKIHSLIVYTTMGILFPQLGYHYYSALRWNLNNTIFALICVITVELLWAIYQSDTIQNIKSYINQSINNPYSSRRMNVFFVAFEFFMLCMAIFAAIYFSERQYYMLNWHGVTVSNEISMDLLLLQVLTAEGNRHSQS